MPELDLTLTGLLAELSALSYVQYEKGLADPSYDGAIQPPPGYVQTASFKAPELWPGESKLLIAAQSHKVEPTNAAALSSLAASLRIRDVYFGFALAPVSKGGGQAAGNVIVLRGTQSIQEWVEDVLGSAYQLPVPLVWFDHGSLKLARAHAGFLIAYAFLYGQVLAAAKAFDTSHPCYVTGHSLGAALAVLAALSVDLQVYDGAGVAGRVQMINFAGPRVGDPTFASAYDALLPASYRVTNLADVVPILPPASIFGWQYQHVGTEYSYLDQTGEVGGNHSIANNYVPATNPPKGPVETDAARSYPNTGLGGGP
jgi:hypothetical protein